MPAPKNILVCPLNWGLGHATRCVPIIQHLLNEQNKVIIAADGIALTFLQQEFPQLLCLRLKGFNIRYFPKPFMQLGLMLQMPLMALSWYNESIRVKKMVKTYKIDQIISDNRYGVRHRGIFSVLITHQLYIQVPRFLRIWKKPLYGFTMRLLNRFNEVWIPDFDDDNRSLTGNLSHPAPIKLPVKYIGPLSRFNQHMHVENMSIQIPDVLIMLSGPGKQKELLAKKLIPIFQNLTLKVLIIGGKPGFDYSMETNNIKQINHLSTNELGYLLMQCPNIIARAGYSTIMDLIALNRTAMLVPTPGQWEQEYLARNEKLQQRFIFLAENNLSKTAIDLFITKN